MWVDRDNLQELRQFAAAGNEYVQAQLATAPLILPENQLWYDCYIDLCSMRPPAFEGMNRLPRDKIAWYAEDELGLSGDDRRAFIWMMDYVDVHFIQHEKQKAVKK